MSSITAKERLAEIRERKRQLNIKKSAMLRNRWRSSHHVNADFSKDYSETKRAAIPSESIKNGSSTPIRETEEPMETRHEQSPNERRAVGVHQELHEASINAMRSTSFDDDRVPAETSPGLRLNFLPIASPRKIEEPVTIDLSGDQHPDDEERQANPNQKEHIVQSLLSKKQEEMKKNVTDLTGFRKDPQPSSNFRGVDPQMGADQARAEDKPTTTIRKAVTPIHITMRHGLPYEDTDFKADSDTVSTWDQNAQSPSTVASKSTAGSRERVFFPVKIATMGHAKQERHKFLEPQATGYSSPSEPNVGPPTPRKVDPAVQDPQTNTHQARRSPRVKQSKMKEVVTHDGNRVIDISEISDSETAVKELQKRPQDAPAHHEFTATRNKSTDEHSLQGSNVSTEASLALVGVVYVETDEDRNAAVPRNGSALTAQSPKRGGNFGAVGPTFGQMTTNDTVNGSKLDNSTKQRSLGVIEKADDVPTSSAACHSEGLDGGLAYLMSTFARFQNMFQGNFGLNETDIDSTINVIQKDMAEASKKMPQEQEELVKFLGEELEKSTCGLDRNVTESNIAQEKLNKAIRESQLLQELETTPDPDGMVHHVPMSPSA